MDEKLDNSELTKRRKKSIPRYELGYDMIQQKKHVEHLPYNQVNYSPIDFYRGCIAFVSLDPVYLTQSAMVVGAADFNRDIVYLEANYKLDTIVKLKLLPDKTLLVMFRTLSRPPVQYRVHIYELDSGKLAHNFELKHTIGEKEVLVEASAEILLCAQGNEIQLYDIMASEGNTELKIVQKLSHEAPVTCLSLNSELGQVCNLMVSGSIDGMCRVWDMCNGKCLHEIHHSGPMNSVDLIAAGAIVATNTVDQNLVYFWRLRDGKLVNHMEINRGHQHGRQGFKTLCFDETCFTYFIRGCNEFVLGCFSLEKSAGETTTMAMLNKYAMFKAKQEDDSCIIL